APTATAPPASSAPAPPPAESAEVTLRTVYQVIEDGRAVGDIREDVALDLHQLIDNLERELDQGVRDLPSVARILRDKVADRAAEGAMSPETADQLRAALDQLESA